MYQQLTENIAWLGLLRAATRPIDTYTNIIKGTHNNFKGLLYNLETFIMIINKTKNLFGQAEVATNNIEFNDKLPTAFTGNSNTSNDGDNEEEENCCIRFRKLDGEFVCTFYDENGNELSGKQGHFGFDCASVRSVKCVGTLTEEQDANCVEWLCKGTEWWGLFRYSSCDKEIDQLNQNLGGGDGPGMTTSLWGDALKFGTAYYEKAGCCNSAPSKLSVKYETPVTVTVPTPNGICLNRFQKGFTGEGGKISDISNGIIEEVMDDAYRKKNPDITCMDKAEL